MKRHLYLTGLSLLLALPTWACDICGCGVGTYYLGILPQFNKRFGGIRYQTNTLRTHLNPSGERSYLTTDETYHKAELWGAWNLGQRFRVLGFVPVSFNEQRSTEGTTHQGGLSDVSLLGYYRLLDRRSAGPQGQPLIQSLWLGGGLKLPTGRYEPTRRDASGQSPNVFQLGTGSVDFLLNALYDLRLLDAGLNLNANYKLNTPNRYEYRYGHKLTLTALPYYKIRVASALTLAPNAGLVLEHAAQDVTDGRFRVGASGGTAWLAGGGAEASWKRLAAGLSYQTPLRQQLAGGSVRAGHRLATHLSVLF